jgi:hypothetical protein
MHTADCANCGDPAFGHDEDGCQVEGCGCEEYEPSEDELDFSHDDEAA